MPPLQFFGQALKNVADAMDGVSLCRPALAAPPGSVSAGATRWTAPTGAKHSKRAASAWVTPLLYPVPVNRQRISP